MRSDLTGTATTIALQLVATDLERRRVDLQADRVAAYLSVNAAPGSSPARSLRRAPHLQVTATASDGILSNSRTFAWTVTHINRAPTLISPGIGERGERDHLTPVAASDLDGDTLTYSATGLPASLAINAATGLIAGTLSFTSTGTYVVTATVFDGRLTSRQTSRGRRQHESGAGPHEAWGQTNGHLGHAAVQSTCRRLLAPRRDMGRARRRSGGACGTPSDGVMLGQRVRSGRQPGEAVQRIDRLRPGRHSAPVQLTGDLTIEMWVNLSLATRQT